MSDRKNYAVLAMALLAVLALAAEAVSAAQPAEEKIKLLFTRGGGHDWKGFTPVMVKLLEKTGDFEVTPPRTSTP